MAQMGAADLLTDPLDDEVVIEITRAVRGLAFGSVEIVVHDGKVVQIVRTEKMRLGAQTTPRPGSKR